MNLKDLKWNIKRRIEDGAIKVNVNDEEILMKKSKIFPLPFSPKEWTRIYPPVNEHGKVNWFNLLFGGKKNLIKLVIILAIVGMALFGIHQILDSPCVQWCVENPNITGIIN